MSWYVLVSCYLKEEMLWIALVTAHTETPSGRAAPHSFAEHCRGGGGQEVVSMVSSRNVT